MLEKLVIFLNKTKNILRMAIQKLHITDICRGPWRIIWQHRMLFSLLCRWKFSWLTIIFSWHIMMHHWKCLYSIQWHLHVCDELFKPDNSEYRLRINAGNDIHVKNISAYWEHCCQAPTGLILRVVCIYCLTIKSYIEMFLSKILQYFRSRWTFLIWHK